MAYRVLSGLAVSAFVCVCGCETELDPPAVAPLGQSFTYNTTTITTNTTNVYAAPSSLYAALPVRTQTTPPPPPPAIEESPPPYEPSVSALRPGLASTGLAACDAYLARLETCTARILSGPPRQGPSVWTTRDPNVHARMLATFDLLRRNWQRAARYAGGRESLEDSCQISLSTYNDSVRGHCP